MKYDKDTATRIKLACDERKKRWIPKGKVKDIIEHMHVGEHYQIIGLDEQRHNVKVANIDKNAVTFKNPDYYLRCPNEELMGTEPVKLSGLSDVISDRDKHIHRTDMKLLGIDVYTDKSLPDNTIAFHDYAPAATLNNRMEERNKHTLYLALLVVKLSDFKDNVYCRKDIDNKWVMVNAPSGFNARSLFIEAVKTYAPDIYSRKKSVKDMIKEVEELLNS